jgi:NAD(P)-dependent dehydrogenase (short-subunit alcohol dehydrogenase family)
MEGTGRVAVVSGANRGIGLEVARQLARRGLTVVLGARDLAKGEEAARRLRADGLTVLPRQLDVADDASVARLVTGVEADLGRLDVLVNNAAILYDTWQRGADADLAVVHQALETNLFGAWRLCRAAIPLMRRGGYGRIVNVSSGAGSLASMGGGTPAYSVSKAALNALTRILGAEYTRATVARAMPAISRRRSTVPNRACAGKVVAKATGIAKVNTARTSTSCPCEMEPRNGRAQR